MNFLLTSSTVRRFVLLALAGACWTGALAQSPVSGGVVTPPVVTPLDPGIAITTLRLWEGAAPGAHGDAPTDIPTLTVLRPTRSNGTAMIIAPGGAYRALSMNLEGREPADRMAALGITVFVLKYRLSPAYLYPVPLDDARRAIRLVRSLASQYGYSPDRIGMMGFSAGGHLAAMAGTAPSPGDPANTDPVERLSSELNFLVLVYPWLNAMQPQVAGPSGPMINYCSVIPGLTQKECKRWDPAYTPVLHVSSSTPPTFLFHTTEDRTVPVRTSTDFYNAMQAAGRDAELHVFARGGHGAGLGGSDLALSEWPHLLEVWLRARGWLTPPPKPAAAEAVPATSR